MAWRAHVLMDMSETSNSTSMTPKAGKYRPKRIMLLHCYSDRNAGDLAITLSTIALLREIEPSCHVEAVSVFEADDPWFRTDHEVLRRRVDALHPAIAGRLQAGDRKQWFLAWRTITSLPKLALLLLPLPWWLHRALLSADQQHTYDAIMSADLLISKGGSFLCSGRSWREVLRLLRLFVPLLLPARRGRRVVLWGQSIGPIEGRSIVTVANYVLAKMTRIILRESRCMTAYPYIRYPSSRTLVGHDLAFSMPVLQTEETPRVTIGLTVTTVNRSSPRQNEYLESVATTLESLLNDYPYDIEIVPHVTIGTDHVVADQLIQRLPKHLRPRVHRLASPMGIDDLGRVYARQRLLIGTRLHSTIFALNQGTPAVSISYHGTKTEGVFDGIGLRRWVLSGNGLKGHDLIAKVTEALADERYREGLPTIISDIKAKNLALARDVLALADEDRSSEEPRY